MPVTIPRVRARGILGGIVSLALVAAPGAMAQAPATQTDADRTTAEAERNPAADEGQQRGVQAPGRARIKLQLKGIQNGKVDVGERFKAVGTVGPFVPNQEILLLVKRDGQDRSSASRSRSSAAARKATSGASTSAARR